jgi:ATP synthase protein I
MTKQEVESTRVVLTEQQQVELRKRSGRGIARALVAQALMLMFSVVVSWLVAGKYAALSALVGGLAYFLPNAFFALRLLMGLLGANQASPFTFFIGEAFKLGSASVVLGLVAWQGRGWLVWPALLFGLLSVLKGYLLLLAFRKLP